MLDVADPAERAAQAAALLRAEKPVQFDVTKPLDERTLPEGFLEQLLLSGVSVEIDGGVFVAPCDLSYKTIDGRMKVRNCFFPAFYATATVFKSDIDMKGSTFGDLNLGHCDVVEANLSGISVADNCWLESAHVRGLLDLGASKLQTLTLVGANIDGNLSLNGAAVTSLYSQGLFVKMNIAAANARFAANPYFSECSVGGGVMLMGAEFATLFSVSGMTVQGGFSLDRATAKAGLNFDRLSCTWLSMNGATIAGDAVVTHVNAASVRVEAAEVRGALRFGDGSAASVIAKSVTVGGEFSLIGIAIKGGMDLGGAQAAALQFLDADCAAVYSTDGLRASRFGSVTIVRSKIESLRPAHWEVAGDFTLEASTIGTGVIEKNEELGRVVITDTKIGRALFVGDNTVRDGVQLMSVAADGPVVFRSNSIVGDIDIRLSRFRRLDFQNQALPRRLACTSSTVDQLLFDKVTSSNAPADDTQKDPPPPRYENCTIDLESSTYEQIICSVAGLMRCLAPKPSRQQYVVLERALRRSGFDELGDSVYRAGRTRYAESVKTTERGIWIRGKIANWTTGYGLDVTRITLLTIAVPVLVFALVLLSPGSVSQADAAQRCAGLPAWTTAAAAVFATYLGEGSTKAHLTECALLGVLPAHALALPLRLLGVILIPIWLAIATGILKYAVKSGD